MSFSVWLLFSLTSTTRCSKTHTGPGAGNTVIATSIGRFSISPYALMYQNKIKQKNHSSTGEGKSYSSSNSLEDSSYTEVGSIVVYSRKKVFTACILIISDAAEKLHLTAELKSRYRSSCTQTLGTALTALTFIVRSFLVPKMTVFSHQYLYNTEAAQKDYTMEMQNLGGEKGTT